MNWREMAEHLGLDSGLTGQLEQLENLGQQVGGMGNTSIHPGGPAGEGGMAPARCPQTSPEWVR